MNKILRQVDFALRTLVRRIAARFAAQIVAQSLAWLTAHEIISVSESDFVSVMLPQLVAFAVVEVVFTFLEWMWHRQEVQFLREFADKLDKKLHTERENTEIALTLDAGASRADIEETRRLAQQHGFRLPVTRIPGTEENQ